MSAIAFIPVPADYREATLPGAINRIILVNNYIYGITPGTPSSIIRINKTNLAEQITATFAADGKHDNASDILYAPSKDRIYVAFPKTGENILTEVHPATLDRTDVINETDTAGGRVSIDTDNTYLFMLLSAVGNLIVLRRYPLTDFGNPSEADVTTARGADGLIYSDGAVFFVGWAPGADTAPKIYKVNASSLALTSTALVSTGFSVLRLHHTATNSGSLYFISEEVSDKVWVINTTTLSNQLLDLPTGLPDGDHKGLTSDGVSVWNLRDNGLAIRIHSSLETSIYALNQPPNYLNNLIGDGTYLYGTLVDPAKVTRYGINPRPGTVQWVNTVGNVPNRPSFGLGTATDSSGNVLFCGKVSDSIFINKYSPSGGVLWSKQFGSGTAFSVAVDSSDNIYFTGTYSGNGIFGGTPLPYAAGQGDSFVVKLLGADGSFLWGKSFPALSGPGGGYGRGICITGSHIAVTGSFFDQTDFGGVLLTSAGGSDIFVVKMAQSNGDVAWAKGYGEAQAANNDQGNCIVADRSGNLFIGGQFANTVNFGGADLVSSGIDGFLLKLNSNGDHQWSKKFGGSLVDVVNGVAILSDDSVVMTGAYRNTADFGFGDVTSSGAQDIFVVRFNNSGTTLWVRTYYGSYQVNDKGLSIAVDRNDNIVFGAEASGVVDFGNGNTISTPGPGLDILVVKLTSGGNFVWAKAYGNYSQDRPHAITTDPFGNVIVGGAYYGEVNFDGITKTDSAGGAFCAKLLA